jgi:hypothetical protein
MYDILFEHISGEEISDIPNDQNVVDIITRFPSHHSTPFILPIFIHNAIADRSTYFSSFVQTLDACCQFNLMFALVVIVDYEYCDYLTELHAQIKSFQQRHHRAVGNLASERFSFQPVCAAFQVMLAQTPRFREFHKHRFLHSMFTTQLGANSPVPVVLLSTQT